MLPFLNKVYLFSVYLKIENIYPLIKVFDLIFVVETRPILFVRWSVIRSENGQVSAE